MKCNALYIVYRDANLGIFKLQVHIKKTLLIFVFYVFPDVDSESEVLFFGHP